MKILKKGKAERTSQTLKFNCRYCFCEFEIDTATDEYESSFDRNERYYTANCPWCGQRVCINAD